ncbi:S24 family peptidase, partial [Escherichia coli]
DGRKAENIRIINVRGDSMSGTIEPGDLLFVDITVKSFDGDGIYAFLYDDTAHVKRLQMMKDKLLVISDNKSYSPGSIVPDMLSPRTLMMRIFSAFLPS